ncbi:MAG: metallophosphoesterase [Methanosarcinales archaeon]|nr:metallophosphoesterase [Methanosarcinales archaeon]
MVFRVLHLSDLHIGNTYKPLNEIAYQIVNDIENQQFISLDSIVVTGDIFDGKVEHNPEIIKEAVDFFVKLLELINSSKIILNQLVKEDFLFIPGNHDLIRDDCSENQFVKYEEFLTKFYGNMPDFCLSNFSILKPYPESKILFVGFNTCQIEKRNVFGDDCISRFEKYLDNNTLDEYGYNKDNIIEILKSMKHNDYFDYAYVSSEQMMEIKRKISDDFKDFNVIALFHHHFYLFPEILKEYGGTGFIQNYTEFSDFLQEIHVKTILHGHKHFDFEKPHLTEKYYETINILSGGSVSIKGSERHTFNVVDFCEVDESINLTLNKFVYRNEKKEIFKTIVPPLCSSKIDLLSLFEVYYPELYSSFCQFNDNNPDIFFSAKEIIKWIESLCSSFPLSVKKLETNPHYAVFLVHSIYYRILNYNIFAEKTTEATENKIVFENLFNEFLSENLSEHKQQFLSLFELKDLRTISEKTGKFLKMSKKSTVLDDTLSYSLIGIYFTDLNLVLTKYADIFKHDIEHKVNIRIDDNVFHKNVQITLEALKV